MARDQEQQEGKILGRAPTIEATGRRRWLYPVRMMGAFAQKRRAIAIVLILIYLVTPWLSFNGRPLLRLDVLSDTAYAFGMVFRFTDMSYLVFVFLILALTLFIVTAWRGRIWCGMACPQTVFIDWMFRPIEEMIEGNANRRRSRDQQGWTFDRIWRKGLKHTIYIGLAAFIANTFLAYFIPTEQLQQWVLGSPANHPEAFTVMMLVMGAFYFDMAWFREQFCSFLCPYARFQSILLDDSSPVASYDFKRGEPRGKRGQVGDCIDCGLCVRVCPTGIDIRDGIQLECIQCQRCLDACDSVMTNLKRPTGLIRMASQAEIEQRPPISKRAIRLAVYLSLITVVSTGFAWRLSTRTDVGLAITRQEGAAYSRLPDGRLANLFKVRAANRTSAARTVMLSLPAVAGAEVICGDCNRPLAPFEERAFAIVVALPTTTAPPGKITLIDRDTAQDLTVTFIAPKP